MAKIFNLQDDEKFCIFVTYGKRQAIILTMYYIKYLQQKQFGIFCSWLYYLN